MPLKLVIGQFLGEFRKGLAGGVPFGKLNLETELQWIML